MKVYGLSPEHIKELQEIAYEKIGKASVSSLAKQLLLQELNSHPKKTILKSHSQESKRLELRITEPFVNQLKERAAEQNMTANRYATLVLYEHITGEFIPTVNEVQALRDSNYQLHKLGVNINQVAKAINSGTATSLTLKELQNISDTIDNHFRKVGTLLQAARRRV